MRPSCRELAAFMASQYRSAVEIGFGGVVDVALTLRKQGLRIRAGDIRPYLVKGLPTFVDDITSPNLKFYQGAEVLYAIRPPLELVSYIRSAAAAVFADAIIKPLADEFPGGRMEGHGNGVFFVHDV
jgi:hypothetical protein